MNYQLLPDFLSMALLVGVLLVARSREQHANIRLWTVGLLLILMECAARILYGIRTPIGFHRAMHAVALNAYLLAGTFFLSSGAEKLRRKPRSQVFLWANVAPLVLLMTVYALDVRTPWVYGLLVGIGVLVTLGTCILFRRGVRFYVAFSALWVPVAIAVSMRGYRAAIYFVLTFVYASAAVAFADSLPKGSRGKIAVVAGFTMWALCFLTHPWVAELPVWGPFASEVWNMQKFIITVGLLLVVLEQQIWSNEWLALHDELTSLPNRRLFDDRLQYAVARAERDGQRVALFTLDLDGFKAINDSLGHDAGDTLLRQVARNLEAATRRTDTLARMGGDEFALIALDLGVGADTTRHPRELPQTQRIFESLLHAVEREVHVGPQGEAAAARVSASMGVAVYPDDSKDVHALIRIADRRMYEQKATRAAARRGASAMPASLTAS